jgi:predicted transcriptional regulator
MDLKQPCELVVWYVIPATRSILAKELFNLGMKQIEISELLDITQPAVSHYLSDKRGGRDEIELTDEIKKMVKELAFKLSENLASKKDIIAEICEICRKTRTEDILCQLHKSKDEIPDDCNQCMKLNDKSYCPHSFTYTI